jgi:hypothetical protein
MTESYCCPCCGGSAAVFGDGHVTYVNGNRYMVAGTCAVDAAKCEECGLIFAVDGVAGQGGPKEACADVFGRKEPVPTQFGDGCKLAGADREES